MFAFQFDHLNRHGELRQDPQLLQQLFSGNRIKILPIYKQVIAAKEDSLAWLTKDQLTSQIGDLSRHHLIYLGKVENDSIHYCAYRMPSATALIELAHTVGAQTYGLRDIAKILTAQDGYLANVASALNQWHSSHQYCGFCGAETFASSLGFVRRCSNNDCQKDHFPRTDPAIIVAISHTDENGEEQLLLGRQASWPEKRYSLVAGFVEPGESLEQAVKREALEEAGIEVTNVQYQASQPWPFPQSVMLGFSATAINQQIQLQDQELEDAGWFSRQKINQLLKQDELLLPMEFSISRMLVEQWRNK
ncbi:NAD(+) diphosphatase [Kangiella sp. TOML190]|uniref:NAD(+) diphosphatase n=1 Tax=Kangiella sp. TOML190 TaxID=2931351 RepID=UPI00203F410E|nr:NAD(+) diphosphatase [Kangiella sp. TOML190]